MTSIKLALELRKSPCLFLSALKQGSSMNVDQVKGFVLQDEGKAQKINCNGKTLAKDAHQAIHGAAS